MHGPSCCNSAGIDSDSLYSEGSYGISAWVKVISSSLMLGQTVHIRVAGKRYIGLIGKDETPVTGAKSNTAKPRRESCKADKIVSFLCGSESPLLHFSPFMTTLFSNHSVFSASTSLLEHLVLLLPCALLANVIVCHKSILSFKIKGKEREKLLWCHSLCLVTSIITQRPLSFVVKCIKLSIQCSWGA